MVSYRNETGWVSKLQSIVNASKQYEYVIIYGNLQYCLESEFFLQDLVTKLLLCTNEESRAFFRKNEITFSILEKLIGRSLIISSPAENSTIVSGLLSDTNRRLNIINDCYPNEYLISPAEFEKYKSGYEWVYYYFSDIVSK